MARMYLRVTPTNLRRFRVSKPVISILSVRQVMTEMLSTGYPTLALVASELEVSPRTLQRRLAENQMSHSQLVNQVRLARACQLLARRELQISDISRETGYATPSAFSRAFQSWMGASPREFRSSL
jgi:AraC-like DNA-binding protein